MAEENILLRVGIDENQLKRSEQAIIAARTEIDRLKEANKQLADQGQKNSVEFVRNETDIRNLTNTVRENTRVLDANAKISRSTSGSIAELRESVKTLQSQYVNLSKAERENEAVGGALQKQIKAQNDELKSLEQGIGITSRNVGNYTESILEAADGTGLFTKAQQALAAGQKAIKTATDLSTTSTKSFGSALAATGIGAIIVVLGSLISFLTRTQRGMDLVAQATSAVSTFVGVVVDAFSALGEQIIKSVIPTFTSLGDILKGLFTLDFDLVKQGFNGVAEAVSNIEPINILELGKNAVQASKDSIELTKQLQELTRAEKQLDLERANSRKTINQLKLVAEDQTKSLEERAAAAEKALNIELALEQKAIKLAEEKVRIIKAQNDLTESLDADNNRLIDAQIELANLQQESAEKQIELNNKLNTLRAQSNKETIQGAKQVLKETEVVAENQNKIFQDKLKEQAKETDLAIRASINTLKQQFADGLIDLDTYQEQLDQVEALALETRRTALQAQLEETRNNALIDAETRLSIEQNLQDQLRRIEDQEIEAAVKLRNEQIRLNQEKEKQLEEDTKKRAAAQIQAEQAVLQAAINVFGAQSAAGKIAASFQALIDTYRGANLALATVPPPFGAIVAAATVASGLSNVAKINSSSKPKFAEGGGIEVSGPSHAGGGVPVALGGQTVAEVEGGEGLFVMKKNAFQSLKALSNFNQMFGGRSWLGGGQRFLSDGGAVARASAPTLDRRSLQDAQQSFTEGVRGIQVVAKISDINRVQREVKTIEVQGDLR